MYTKRSCGVIKYVEETLGLLLWASFLSINLALLSHADKPHELIVISILNISNKIQPWIKNINI